MDSLKSVRLFPFAIRPMELLQNANFGSQERFLQLLEDRSKVSSEMLVIREIPWEFKVLNWKLLKVHRPFWIGLSKQFKLPLMLPRSLILNAVRSTFRKVLPNRAIVVCRRRLMELIHVCSFFLRFNAPKLS